MTDDDLRHNYLKRVEAKRRQADRFAEPAESKVIAAFGGHDLLGLGPWLLEEARERTLARYPGP